jgi:hypothetical protein
MNRLFNPVIRGLLLASLVLFWGTFGLAVWVNEGDLRAAAIIALIFTFVGLFASWVVLDVRASRRDDEPAIFLIDRIDTTKPWVWVLVMVAGVAWAFLVHWRQSLH